MSQLNQLPDIGSSNTKKALTQQYYNEFKTFLNNSPESKHFGGDYFIKLNKFRIEITKALRELRLTLMPLLEYDDLVKERHKLNKEFFGKQLPTTPTSDTDILQSSSSNKSDKKESEKKK